jgi:hypothetical protein
VYKHFVEWGPIESGILPRLVASRKCSFMIKI